MWRMMSNDTFFDSLDLSGENKKKISLTIGPIFELRGEKLMIIFPQNLKNMTFSRLKQYKKLLLMHTDDEFVF